jgi:hypothetical protein
MGEMPQRNLRLLKNHLNNLNFALLDAERPTTKHLSGQGTTICQKVRRQLCKASEH